MNQARTLAIQNNMDWYGLICAPWQIDYQCTEHQWRLKDALGEHNYSEHAQSEIGKGVIGISNFFGKQSAIEACIAEVAKLGLPLVGYDRLEDFEWLEPLGFYTTGKLAIWSLPNR